MLQALPGYEVFEDLDPIVSVKNNFDVLRIPQEHPSRRTSDTYYVNEDTVLRTHTSAHQVELLRQAHEKFLVVGDVYRKDDIDFTHYPVFHQLEGVGLVDDPESGLKTLLSGLIDGLFPGAEWRLKEDYFPFTHPSWEVEVKYQDAWLEILGCGVIHPEVLANAGIHDRTGWAFGIGLDRIAMKLFSIPDIRLLWSEDPRFLEQWKDGQVRPFKPYSAEPPCYKDISYWVSDGYEERDMLDIVRSLGGNLVESVKLTDEFTNKAGRRSKTYRITYRSWDRTLTNDEVNATQERIRWEVTARLPVVLR